MSAVDEPLRQARQENARTYQRGYDAGKPAMTDQQIADVFPAQRIIGEWVDCVSAADYAALQARCATAREALLALRPDDSEMCWCEERIAPGTHSGACQKARAALSGGDQP